MCIRDRVYVYNEGGNLVSRTNYKYTTGKPLLLKRTWLYTYAVSYTHLDVYKRQWLDSYVVLIGASS